jgi:hypothetical protein
MYPAPAKSELHTNPPNGILSSAQNHSRAREGEISLARRRWQQGTVYLRKSKNLPDAWWGRFKAPSSGCDT